MKYLTVILALLFVISTAEARIYTKTKKGIKIYQPKPVPQVPQPPYVPAPEKPKTPKS